MDKKKMKRSLWLSALWLLLLGGSLTGAVFAWFTFSPDANVRPLQGNMVVYEPDVVDQIVTETVTETVTEQLPDELQLLIATNQDDEFQPECVLKLISDTGDMYPVSTDDLNSFVTSVEQDENGISVAYEDISSDIDVYTLHGFFYLKAINGSCQVGFDSDTTSYEGDAQILAASRLGIRFRSLTTNDTITKIIDLSSEGDTSAALSRWTIPTAYAGSVVGEVDTSGNAVYVTENAESMRNLYDAKIIDISDNEIYEVEYWLYLEGCDEHCYNAVTDTSIEFSFGFKVL